MALPLCKRGKSVTFQAYVHPKSSRGVAVNYVVRKTLSPSMIAIVIAIFLFAGPAVWNRANAVEKSGLPNPAVDAPLAAKKGKATAVVAGGCFWGVQAVFQHVKGVKDVTSGYSGGSALTAQYETVGTGSTGHAESVEITYDPAVISYGKLLKVYFEIAHNPTELNYQ